MAEWPASLVDPFSSLDAKHPNAESALWGGFVRQPISRAGFQKREPLRDDKIFDPFLRLSYGKRQPLSALSGRRANARESLRRSP